MQVDDPHLPEIYTVIASGVEFKLTRSQIEFDSPNYFTAAFLDHDFSESASRILVIDKDPLLFKYITLYLSGYEIFPLQIAAIPFEMSVESATKNILRDAEYFGLSMSNKRPYDSRWLINQKASIIDIEDVTSGKVRLVWELQQSDRESRLTHNVKIAGQPNIQLVILKLPDVLTLFTVSVATVEHLLAPSIDIYMMLRLKFEAHPSGGIICRSTTITDRPFELGEHTRGLIDPPIEINGLLGSEQLLLQYLQEYEEVPEEFTLSETIAGPTFSYLSVAHLIQRFKEDVIFQSSAARQQDSSIPPNTRGYRNTLPLFATSLYVSLRCDGSEDDNVITVHFEGATCIPSLSACADSVLRS